ncbi:MAG: hypothetical protein K2W80_11345 [Burkholderiales bacterium]|nr:hypothetical protein [Burkholderiales bacterium]
MIRTDAEAWQAYPDDRWVYDRLELATLSGYPCGPAGTEPPAKFQWRNGWQTDWWMKPILNLDGMGLGSRPYQFPVPPGHFWMPRFYGEHLSLDFEFTGGAWMCVLAVRAVYGPAWRVAMWERVSTEGRVLPRALQVVDASVVNIETIGGNLIEAHLRGNPDFAGVEKGDLIVVWADDPRVVDATRNPYFIPAPEDCDGQLKVPRVGFLRMPLQRAAEEDITKTDGWSTRQTLDRMVAASVGHVPSRPDKMSHCPDKEAAKHGSEKEIPSGTRPNYPWPGEPE